jgi:hypothetical protein
VHYEITVEIPKSLCPPPGFGIHTRRISSGRYVPCRSAVCSLGSRCGPFRPLHLRFACLHRMFPCFAIRSVTPVPVGHGRYRLHRPLATRSGCASGWIRSTIGLRRKQQVLLSPRFVLGFAVLVPFRAVGECEGQLPWSSASQSISPFCSTGFRQLHRSYEEIRLLHRHSIVVVSFSDPTAEAGPVEIS